MLDQLFSSRCLWELPWQLDVAAELKMLSYTFFSCRKTLPYFQSCFHFWSLVKYLFFQYFIFPCTENACALHMCLQCSVESGIFGVYIWLDAIYGIVSVMIDNPFREGEIVWERAFCAFIVLRKTITGLFSNLQCIHVWMKYSFRKNLCGVYPKALVAKTTHELKQQFFFWTEFRNFVTRMH